MLTAISVGPLFLLLPGPLIHRLHLHSGRNLVIMIIGNYRGDHAQAGYGGWLGRPVFTCGRADRHWASWSVRGRWETFVTDLLLTCFGRPQPGKRAHDPGPHPGPAELEPDPPRWLGTVVRTPAETPEDEMATERVNSRRRGPGLRRHGARRRARDGAGPPADHRGYRGRLRGTATGIGPTLARTVRRGQRRTTAVRPNRYPKRAVPGALLGAARSAVEAQPPITGGHPSPAKREKQGESVESRTDEKASGPRPGARPTTSAADGRPAPTRLIGAAVIEDPKKYRISGLRRFREPAV